MSNATSIGVSLLIGLLIGIERGWHERDAGDGQRIAGIRTFSLIGLFGGVCAAFGDGAPLVLGAGLLGLAGVLAFAQHAYPERRDHGITTLIAALLTYGLGALAVHGEPAIAGGAAVLTTALLGLKQPIHQLLQRLQGAELLAALQLLLLAVVVMPLLPKRALDPWQLISPYEFAGLVLLLALLSFAGYAAVRLFGWRLGALMSGAAGGLVSSTAVIVSWAPLLREAAASQRAASGAMLAACGVMPMRVLVLGSLIAPVLAPQLIVPALLMTATLLPFILLRLPPAGAVAESRLPLRNPMSLWSAGRFAVLLVIVMIAVELARRHFGAPGPLYAAAVGGLADVDAVTLTLARLVAAGSDGRIATTGMVLAMLVNNVVKATMAGVLGGRPAWRQVAAPLMLSNLAGGLALFLV
ncbi:MgtC/SapB family protein [Solimonas variicoloris]|uniref:MgtC/SapB family protein n=1 Tax=Solimonas variicoloris TaxID=254408 RepID=UPI000371BB74|nr:MgtC/SapB family protein [Solimonas variicoloris]